MQKYEKKLTCDDNRSVLFAGIVVMTNAILMVSAFVLHAYMETCQPVGIGF